MARLLKKDVKSKRESREPSTRREKPAAQIDNETEIQRERLRERRKERPVISDSGMCAASIPCPIPHLGLRQSMCPSTPGTKAFCVKTPFHHGKSGRAPSKGEVRQPSWHHEAMGMRKNYK